MSNCLLLISEEEAAHCRSPGLKIQPPHRKGYLLISLKAVFALDILQLGDQF